MRAEEGGEVKATKKTSADFNGRTYSIYRHMEKRARDAAWKSLTATLDFTLDDFRAMVELKLGYNPLCEYCRQGMTVKTFSLDHKTPVSRGGTFGKGNTQLICAGCNRSKGNFTDAEYRVLLKKLDEAEAETRNFEMKRMVLTGMRVAQSFRQGANRRAKKSPPRPARG